MTLTTRPGWGGEPDGYSGYGPLDGEGRVRNTVGGVLVKTVPMSLPLLMWPPKGHFTNLLPELRWMDVHDSTENGAVTGYLLAVDNNEDFNSPQLLREVTVSELLLVYLPFDTYNWRVIAQYSEPPGTSGPASNPGSFTFRNAVPRFNLFQPLLINEREVKTFNLTNYIWDSDTPPGFLTLESTDPNVVSIEGLEITLRYDDPMGSVVVPIVISDGISRVNADLQLIVVDINDPPEIVSIGNMTPPVTIDMDEGSERWIPIDVVDPDGDNFHYELFNSWHWVDILKNGTLHITAHKGRVGKYYANLVVEDDRKGVAGSRITINVNNVVDPPGTVEVYAPNDRGRYLTNEYVSFTVKVNDPDIVWGEFLEVVWTSDRSGVLKRAYTQDVAHFTTNELPPGEHIITITVSDGTYSAETWISILIEEEMVEPPPVRPVEDAIDLIVLVLFIVMPIAGYLLGYKGVSYGRKD
jgi:hypothetical protein